MTAADVVARARSAIDRPTVYKLGQGGFNASNEHPADKDSELDCSGFCAWALGVSRWVRDPHPWLGRFPSEWVSTSSIYDDARKTLKVFRSVVDALAGDLLVFPDGQRTQGHVGVVSEAIEGVPSLVVHASAGNFRAYQDAIKETPVQPFWKNRGAIIARPVDYS